MHECPDCYDGCYCGGDIDDMLMGDTREEQHCNHACSDVDGAKEWLVDEESDAT